MLQTPLKPLPIQSATLLAPLLAVCCGEVKRFEGSAAQDTWHGSAPNDSADLPRRAIAVHVLRGDVTWAPGRAPSYIYGRYKLTDEDCPRRDFFPLTFTRNAPPVTLARD